MKKNFICNFILSGLLLLSPLSMFAQRVDSNLPWSVRMVESEMIRCPESWQLDFQPKLKWDSKDTVPARTSWMRRWMYLAR
jgi:unsaturated rhamnogalacturonyl hydrolase